jgi:MFS family permease
MPSPIAQERRAVWVLLAAFLFLAVSFGVRIAFGVVLPDMTVEFGYAVATISAVMAVQNLMWGAAQPFAGRLADRYGAAPVAFSGALIYAGGLLLTAFFRDPWIFGLSAGVILGLAQAALGLPVLLGAIGRTVSDKRRGLFLGIATAGGSFGQLVFSPLSQSLAAQLGLVDAFLALAAICFGAAALALLVRLETRPDPPAAGAPPPERLSAILGRAARDRNFLLLNAGFFVCGFHVAFIGVHLPNFAAVCGLPVAVGVQGLMLIGAFNIAGTILAGQLGGMMAPRLPLSAIYFLRAAAAGALLIVPVTETVLLAFSAVMGILWLSTVPLTNLIVARLHGAANVGMLFGIVFFSHQLGSFAGLLMAGKFFALFGNYDAMWIASVVLGLFAGFIHLPIRDAAPRPAAA